MATKRKREDEESTVQEQCLLFILAGQSNMAGRGPMPSPESCTEFDNQIFCFSQTKDEEKWNVAKHPLHQDKPEKAGVGLGLSFARKVINYLSSSSQQGQKKDDNIKYTIGLIPCAYGGSEIARWEYEKGDLFNDCIRRVKAACLNINQINKSVNKKNIRIAGILWHQGESDCNHECAAIYSHRLPIVIEKLREEVAIAASTASSTPDATATIVDKTTNKEDNDDLPTSSKLLPVIVGELPYALDQKKELFVKASEVNKVIVSLPDRIKQCRCVSAHGLHHRGDRLHFDSPSLVELGYRYAACWIELEELRTPNDNVDQEGSISVHPFSFPSAEESMKQNDAKENTILD